MRGAIAMIVAVACGGGDSKHAPSLPVQRPADLGITLVRAGGVQGGRTKVTIDPRGAQVDETAGRWQFDVTDAERDALWGDLRAAVVYEPKPGAPAPNAPDRQRADVTIDFGSAEYRTEDTQVYGAIIDLYAQARSARLPEQRPADLTASLSTGGGIDGIGSTIEIAGGTGTYSDTDGHHRTLALDDAALDTLWGTIRAADPATIATSSIILAPDTKVRVVAVGWNGRTLRFGGADQVAPDAAARVQSIDDAIMKLAPPP